MGKLYLGTQEISPFVYDGGIPGKPLNPAQVYHDTRPADWLPMPTPANNEIYLLVEVSKSNQEKDPGTPLAFSCRTSTGQYQVELGTVTGGQFVADSAYTTLVNSDSTYSTHLYYADWATNPMTNGAHQIMVKITSPSGNLTRFGHIQPTVYGNNEWGGKHTLEFRGHCEGMTSVRMGSDDADGRVCESLRYFSLEGTSALTSISFCRCVSLIAVLQMDTSLNSNFNSVFSICRRLIAIPQLDTSSGTSFNGMFNDCNSLTTIPQLNTSSGTDFRQMFSNCNSLTTIPQLNTSSGTDFRQMFLNCYSLTTIPRLDTSSGTNFNSMFGGCSALTSIPQLDTSSGMYFASMFANCHSLVTIPQLDTSSGTTFINMFSNCYSLTTIPQLNTSSSVDFSGMFNYCYSLATIPQLNTSSGTNFQQMFNYCYSLTTVPPLDTSSGTNFSSMFSYCTALTTNPVLDTSSGTNFNSMFNNCVALKYIDLVGYDFTSVTSANNRPTGIPARGGGVIRIDNKFQMGTGGFNNTVIGNANGVSSTNPAFILIEDEETMLPLGANGSTVFGGSIYTYVVVPDSMYDTYAANSYWSSLGTRLKRRSDVTLPDWYTN